jgi:RHS repeat-associated protein
VQTAQTAPCYDADFSPFGGERPAVANSCAQNYKFTGKERDGESGLDFFGARYYSSFLGRYVSPDWSSRPTAIPYADLGNPQSLNLYIYADDNPTSDSDLDGHCDWMCTPLGL